MPFTEHRGGGKASADVTSMQKRWDAEWQSCTGAGIPDLTSSENWPWVREYIRPPARVLEAGCGFARWVAFLDAQGYEAYGLDYSPVAVERSLAAWPKLRLTVGDLRRLPYEDGFFDGIVSFGAIEHDPDGPEAALAEMRRVLRSGGTMFCTVPCMNVLRRCGLMALQDWIVCNPTIRRLTGASRTWSFLNTSMGRPSTAGFWRRPVLKCCGCCRWRRSASVPKAR